MGSVFDVEDSFMVLIVVWFLDIDGILFTEIFNVVGVIIFLVDGLLVGIYIIILVVMDF